MATDAPMPTCSMSEDEFVVLVEHAGIVEVADENALEFIEREQLVEWLTREGADLFGARFLASSGDDDDRDRNGTTECNASLAERILSRLQDGEDVTLYALRLPTTEAYRIYIEKDAVRLPVRNLLGKIQREVELHSEVDSSSYVSRCERRTWQASTSLMACTTTQESDEAHQMSIRERLWQDCFPTCSEGCKQIFFSFDNPVIILYATLGLNLIGNGISSVPAFSRELRSLGVSAEDRTVIVSFLARAFPTE
ncbi:TPA: hypothetical protein N0F65_004267 [Lagenidium giganteum]|uniref:Uncharacterized protein n=1 Tax=Lagenidium giganteum TaxID=4803 RepID=A0AAV2ZG91_9STRA|nr:TPA: hypothetical protein N0F65_004267 [Lagenidium giganteum]